MAVSWLFNPTINWLAMYIIIRVTWIPQPIYQCVWDLLGMCSSLRFGAMVTAGLLTNPAALPLFRPPVDADWVMVRMLFPREAGGWQFEMPPFRLGDGVWMEASWLVMSLSCWSWFLLTAASGACSLTEVTWNITRGLRGRKKKDFRHTRPGKKKKKEKSWDTCRHLKDFLLVLSSLLQIRNENSIFRHNFA